MSTRALSIWSLVLLLLVGCAGPQQKEKAKPIFYPPLPNSPRIQHLIDLSSPSDLLKKADGLKSFLFGKETTRDHLVRKPYGVSVHDGKIYVADSRGGGYGIFDVKQKRADFVRGSLGGGSMRKPINITVTKEGEKYVTDIDRRQILRFDKDDKFIRAYGNSSQLKPVDVLILENKLFVTDLVDNQIKVFHRDTGQILYTIGTSGSGEGELFQPTNLALGPNQELYVTDTANFRVQVFTLDGKFLKSFGKVGDSVGHFARPKGVSVDREGHIYVVDAAFENVQILNSDGRAMLFFSQSGDQPGNINLPTDITIDYENVEYFQEYADPNFKLEYIILVTSQFGLNKVSVFGFGKMDGYDYDSQDKEEIEEENKSK